MPETEPSEVPKRDEFASTAEVEINAPAEPQVAEAATPVTPEPVTPAPKLAQSAAWSASAAPPAQGEVRSKRERTKTEQSTDPGAAVPKAPSPPKLAEATPTALSMEATKPKTVAERVALPRRKPESTTPKQTKAVAKQKMPAAEPEQPKFAATSSTPRWTPMALAPADKDNVGKPKLAPKRTESAGGYNAKIWATLARHKPRAGKAGSAVVTFAIGPAGGLRSAQISGSSGDSKLDQMALQAVRNAAPFPPPPNPASATFTIRIYFR